MRAGTVRGVPLGSSHEASTKIITAVLGSPITPPMLALSETAANHFTTR
jgi:hypothetical protein